MLPPLFGPWIPYVWGDRRPRRGTLQKPRPHPASPGSRRIDSSREVKSKSSPNFLQTPVKKEFCSWGLPSSELPHCWALHSCPQEWGSHQRVTQAASRSGDTSHRRCIFAEVGKELGGSRSVEASPGDNWKDSCSSWTGKGPGQSPELIFISLSAN